MGPAPGSAGRPFPLWLVRILRFSGDGDPGHEAMWRRPDEAIRSGEIPMDLETRGFVGFLLHLRHGRGKLDRPPNGDWFPPDTGARQPKPCPAGVPSAALDPELASIARAIRQERPPPRSRSPQSRRTCSRVGWASRSRRSTPRSRSRSPGSSTPISSPR